MSSNFSQLLFLIKKSPTSVLTESLEFKMKWHLFCYLLFHHQKIFESSIEDSCMNVIKSSKFSPMLQIKSSPAQLVITTPSKTRSNSLKNILNNIGLSIYTCQDSISSQELHKILISVLSYQLISYQLKFTITNS